MIQLAREAGIANESMGSYRFQSLFRFAALVAATEREACAAICKKNGDEWTARNPRRQHHTGAGIGALACRDEILARGKTDPDGYGTATAG